jgi:hypothetical protein
MILDQHEVVKRATRSLELAKIEASACRKDLDAAQMRLSNLIDKARSGQTDLFDGEAPQGEGVAEPANAQPPGEQAPLFGGDVDGASPESDGPDEHEGEDDPEGEE